MVPRQQAGPDSLGGPGKQGRQQPIAMPALMNKSDEPVDAPQHLAHKHVHQGGTQPAGQGRDGHDVRAIHQPANHHPHALSQMTSMAKKSRRCANFLTAGRWQKEMPADQHCHAALHTTHLRSKSRYGWSRMDRPTPPMKGRSSSTGARETRSTQAICTVCSCAFMTGVMSTAGSTLSLPAPPQCTVQVQCCADAQQWCSNLHARACPQVGCIRWAWLH